MILYISPAHWYKGTASKCDCAIQLTIVWGCFQVHISSQEHDISKTNTDFGLLIHTRRIIDLFRYGRILIGLNSVVLDFRLAKASKLMII